MRAGDPMCRGRTEIQIGVAFPQRFCSGRNTSKFLKYTVCRVFGVTVRQPRTTVVLGVQIELEPSTERIDKVFFEFSFRRNRRASLASARCHEGTVPSSSMESSAHIQQNLRQGVGAFLP